MEGSKVNGGGADKKGNREKNQRDGKTDEQIEKLIKSLGNSLAPEEKIAQLAKNIVEMEKEHNKKVTAFKTTEKHFDCVQREKEHLQKEYNKGILMKDKLEQVCREQQKLMKSIKSENVSRIREEEEKRKETQAHFQQSINEIFATLGKNNDENVKLKEANLEMTKKFKFLAEQYELREKQLEKINEQINLNTQLNDAKMAKLKMEGTIEREILLKEKEAALETLLAQKKSIVDMQTREKMLKEQLKLYTEKYEDFQGSLKKSNDIFTVYKNEIEKMAKKIKQLEKESYEWRSKFEKSNRAVLDMASDKQAQDEYVAKTARQIAQLQKLCRTLQAERTSLIDVLKTNNIERPPMPDLPPEPTDIAPPPKSADKLDMMSRNCAELKKSLAQLQGQMNMLATEKSTKQEETNAETKTTTATKKNKNKKNKTKTCPMKERQLQQTHVVQPAAAAEDSVATNGTTNALSIDKISQIIGETSELIKKPDKSATLLPISPKSVVDDSTPNNNNNVPATVVAVTENIIEDCIVNVAENSVDNNFEKQTVATPNASTDAPQPTPIVLTTESGTETDNAPPASTPAEI